LRIYDALDDAEQIEGAAREAVDPRHRHHVTGGQLAEHPVEFAPVRSRAGRLLPVDIPATASGGAKLYKLAVEGLPHGADAGIADEPFFRMNFDHNLWYPARLPLPKKLKRATLILNTPRTRGMSIIS